MIHGERQMTTNPITLTACEAAKVLGLAPSTLAKLRLFGNGPTYCKSWASRCLPQGRP
jgi:hypothetical protein